MKGWLTVLLLMVFVGGSACESRRRENIYKPGGKFAQRLDARGRRHLIHDGGGALLAKVRVRGDSLRVYDAEMVALGDVALPGEAGATLTVRRQLAEPVAITPVDGAVELPGSFRIEHVNRGWAVFDAMGRRVGYIERGDDGRLALRDDFNAAPRAYSDGEVVRTSARGIAVRATPALASELLLPFALKSDRLDPLTRVALGAWLQTELAFVGPRQR